MPNSETGNYTLSVAFYLQVQLDLLIAFQLDALNLS